MKTLLLGKGGHARVVQSLRPDIDFYAVDYDEEQNALNQPPCAFANGIGVQGAKLNTRIAAYTRFCEKGFTPLTLISNHSFCEGKQNIAQGVQILAGAILQTNVILHENCVINTGASLDHDCIIHKHAFVAPRAILCGGVEVGEGAFLGAGCIIFPNVKIKPFSLVPAGEIVK
jgi:UDP-3-O-[3-hydroxymyristoyl] glucosamine N-acyltransferase